jgi:hypothetical protein
MTISQMERRGVDFGMETTDLPLPPERLDQIAEIREQLRRERSPRAMQFDRRAVCIGCACQIATAQSMGREVVAVNVGYVRFASTVAAHDIKTEPEADEATKAALVVANVIGLHRACGLPIDYDTLPPDQRLIVRSVETIIASVPAATFEAVVDALEGLIDSGWRDISGAA